MEPDGDEASEIQREERAIYVVIALASSPAVIDLLIEHGAFDAGTTISLICVVLAIAGLVFGLRRRPRVPRAQARFRGRDRVA